jgi:hypothetical protein
MADAHTNFAYSTVATAPSPADTGTTLSVQSGHGARFPAAPFNAAVWPANQNPLVTNATIIRVTSKGSGDDWTIVRDQEGSSARSIQVGDQIHAGPTKKWFDDIEPFTLPSYTSNARKILRTDGSTSEWVAQNPGLTTYTVAANDASDRDKAVADYVCDGTADNVEIQAAIDAVEANGGGTVLLSEGTFAIATGLTIQGTSNSDSYNITLKGQGNETTKLNGANNVDVITLSNIPKVHISDIQIGVLGTGDGIVATAYGSSPYRSFWNSSFKNIYVRGDFSGHSGWAFYLENPFRSVFENIEANGVGNGIHLRSTNSNFNPGNLLFKRCFVDLSQANGIGYQLYTVDGGGQFNICTFIQCEAIDSEATSTTSVGWHFRGSSSSYHATKNIYILSSNVEQFNTAIKLEKAIQNTLQFNYIDVKTGGTIVSADSNSNGNDITILSGFLASSATANLIVDANTNANAPNVVRRFEAFLSSGSALNATVTSATQFDRINTSGSGTLDTDIPNGKTVYAEDVRVPDEAYGAGWNGSLEVPTKNAVYDKIETIASNATDTATGVVELATIAEVDTGTDATRAVTPDALAGSDIGEKGFAIAVFESDANVTVGDGKVGFVVPSTMNGMNIVDCVASVHTSGTTGTTDVQIRRRRGTTNTDVLSTKLTIDSTETSSTTAAAAYAINTSNDDLATGDIIYIDVDAVSTTPPTGLCVGVVARKP